jgi:hypothetical protein
MLGFKDIKNLTDNLRRHLVGLFGEFNGMSPSMGLFRLSQPIVQPICMTG